MAMAYVTYIYYYMKRHYHWDEGLVEFEKTIILKQVARLDFGNYFSKASMMASYSTP